VGILSNFAHRTLTLVHKHFAGRVPAAGSLEVLDEEALVRLQEFPERIETAIENYRFREGINAVMDLARLGNKYLTETQPWITVKTDLIGPTPSLTLPCKLPEPWLS
jgi:methionyl-tRNA synthetase